MACRLVGAKPFSEIWIEIYMYFHSRKYIWNCRQEIGGHFVSASGCLLHPYAPGLHNYRKVSNIRRTKYQNLNASRLIL